ncbi:MAG: prolipoprotein diacylglyceryl transferase [Pseudomonadota bacterium]
MPPFAIPFPNIDEALFTIALGNFEFAIRWYALAYIVGLIIGWRLMVWLMRRPKLWPNHKAPMPPEAPEALLTWMVIGVLLGGRLGYVLFYQPGRFLGDPTAIFRVWEGGMSFHGGFLGVILATIAFTRLRSIPLLQGADAVALAAPAGIFLGRVANFINAELYGRPTDVWWAMQFPLRGPDGERDWSNLTEPRHPSQLYEAALEGALLFAAMWWLAVRTGWLKRPGAIAGTFFIGYGLARAFVENFRQGDPQFVSPANPSGQIWRLGSDADAFGLTIGQILTLPMIAVGIALLWIGFARQRAA